MARASELLISKKLAEPENHVARDSCPRLEFLHSEPFTVIHDHSDRPVLEMELEP
jgi:hypothetical protein